MWNSTACLENVVHLHIKLVLRSAHSRRVCHRSSHEKTHVTRGPWSTRHLFNISYNRYSTSTKKSTFRSHKAINQCSGKILEIISLLEQFIISKVSGTRRTGFTNLFMEQGFVTTPKSSTNSFAPTNFAQHIRKSGRLPKKDMLCSLKRTYIPEDHNGLPNR